MTLRLALPNRRNHTTLKVHIDGQRTLHISLHDHAWKTEISLRLKGSACSSELSGLYNVVTRLMSIVLQFGTSLDKVGNRWSYVCSVWPYVRPRSPQAIVRVNLI